MDSNQLEQLLRQAKQGDQQALTQLYEQTKNYAYFAAKRYVKNDEDIQDILQDVYIAAFNGLDTLTEPSAFESWLYKIVVYKCLNFVKQKKVIVLPEDAAGEIPDDEELIPSAWLERAEKRRDILHIIDALPDGQRIAIVLFYLEGLSVAEIAEQMELATGTVKAHLYHGRKAIKAAVLKEEKKGNKLYGVVAVPLLTQLMRMEAQAATMPPQLSSAILESTLHSVGAGAASSSASSASEIGGDSVSSAATDSATKSNSFLGGISMKAKIGAGILVVALIAGVALFATRSSEPDTVDVMQPEIQETSQEETSTQEEEEPEPEPEPDYEVTFTSENLETMLRSYLGNEDAPIMRSDLAEITELAIVGGDVLIVNGEGEYEFTYETKPYQVTFASGASITYDFYTSIQSCQYTNAQTGEAINVSRGEWSIFEDFEHLSNLESLAIVYCVVDDMQNISSLLESPSLKSLDFTGSILPDIQPLATLTGLEKLCLDYTNVRDFSAVSQLVNLKEFGAEGCEISDIGFLSGLSQMEDLDLYMNQVADLTPLSGMTNLQVLDLGFNQITDVSPLSNSNMLTKVYFDVNQISDISMLGNLSNLEEFDIQSNNISDISIFQGSTKLTYLSINTNNVSDISAVSNLTNLEHLCFADNPVSTLEPLRGLTKLEKLEFAVCYDISDLSPLSNLTNLTYLVAAETAISDLSPLANLTKLEIVYLYRCPGITNISVVANMPNLEYLDLYLTGVSDLSPASHVPDVYPPDGRL